MSECTLSASSAWIGWALNWGRPRFSREPPSILYTLAKRPGIVFTRYQIVDALHGSDHIVTERAVDVQIAYLRKKLGSCKDYIETIRGVGYRFRDHPMG
ncbi:MAG TPA: winged helix-turn-helix domain-containing protein [Sedimentisphaerales bacterium]|jgi:DNA-binding response OmpR family regulator|nr:winged helix-turn-helix domain-containing protein [Sedimentisphaerales bacterium]